MTPLQPGERFGPWEMVAIAGIGTSAVVYRARYVSEFERDDMPTLAALKIFPTLNGERRADVLNEYRHARTFWDCPYIARIYPPTEVGEQVGLVYELGEHSLRDRLSKGPLSSDDLRQLVHDMTEALASLHERNTIHSDVKPANILWADGHWKLTDLGAATHFGLGDDDGTVAALRAYNRPYMSPEMAAQLVNYRPGEPLTTRRSDDMWALGITLYEAALGVHPYTQSGVRSAAELLDLTIPARLYQTDAGLSVGEIIETCLDPIADRRWRSATMLRGISGISGISGDGTARVVTRAEGAVARPQTRMTSRTGATRRRKVAAVALLGLVGVAGAARAMGQTNHPAAFGTTSPTVLSAAALSSPAAPTTLAPATTSIGTTVATTSTTPVSTTSAVTTVPIIVTAQALADPPATADAAPANTGAAAKTTARPPTPAAPITAPATTGPATTAPVSTTPATTATPAGTTTAPVSTAPATTASPPVTDPPTPNPPTELSPIGAVGGAAPTFRWTAVPGATGYLIWANQTGNPFVAGKINLYMSPGEAGCESGAGTCSRGPGVTFPTGGVWWVTAWATDGTKLLSQGAEFTTA